MNLNISNICKTMDSSMILKEKNKQRNLGHHWKLENKREEFSILLYLPILLGHHEVDEANFLFIEVF